MKQTPDAALLGRIFALRPWWWRLNPWRYVRELEDHVRLLYEALEEGAAVDRDDPIPPRCGEAA